MAPALRRRFESRFGADLGDVRLHTDADAAESARSRRAHAFTFDNDVYFAAGRYRPDTSEGMQRIAHELVHVQQQRAGGTGTDVPSAEREAQSAAAAVADGRSVRITQGIGPTVLHDDDDTAPARDTSLHLDPELEGEAAHQFVRWWLGMILLEGDAPTDVALEATEAGDATAAARPTVDLSPRGVALDSLFPAFRLRPDFFAPLPPDPLWLDPDAQALFSGFGARGAPVGAGDSAVVQQLYRDRYRLVLGLPDLRAAAPDFIRPLIPLTWRRDIAGALTGATVNFALRRDYATPLEVADQSYLNMTGVSTTIISLPAISFDFP